MDSGIPWFTFSFSDFCFAFVSVLLEGVPFILLGTIISGLIDQFLPARVMTRLLPKNPFLAICVSGGMGIIFPMCECGIVPVIRRLMAKGLPVSSAVAYMLAAPIVNPIVALSTYAAFRGQGAAEMTALRMGLGYLLAVLTALAVHHLAIRLVLKDKVLAEVMRPGGAVEGSASGPFGMRLRRAMFVSVRDFLDVMFYFVLGVAAASLFSTAVNQAIILPLATDPWMATYSLMTVSALLSLCSSSDAFIAATFVAFPAVAKLGFMVFGPMVDLKLVFIYCSVFRKRFVLGMCLGLFLLTGLICVRLLVIQL